MTSSNPSSAPAPPPSLNRLHLNPRAGILEKSCEQPAAAAEINIKELETTLKEDGTPTMTTMKKSLSAVVLLLSLSGFAAAQGEDSPAKLNHRIDRAHEVLHALMNTPDNGIPFDIASKAHCIVVIPSFKKAAFVFGAEYGQGVASCRTGHGWSAPVFVQMEGASFGFQIGGQSTDLVLVGVSNDSMDHLLREKVKLGADASVAAGPVGRNSQAATTELANAAFLTYSRNKGLFAGIDLNGDVVHQNSADTTSYYGKDIPYKVILTGGVPTPASAAHFVKTCNEMFRIGRERDGK
jgi:lipid-binding SYLF domain-containing protein